MSRILVLALLGHVAMGAACVTEESADLVENVPADFSGVVPPPENCGSLPCSTYLLPTSCLGGAGPIGAFGPLGSLGPLGSNSWSPQYWISGGPSWAEWQKQNLDGPLTAEGPLGPNGPLSENAYYVEMPAINDFSQQLQAKGLWTVLGPIGPLGALGPLGPLGPIGATGYQRDASTGQFIDGNGVVHRNYTVPYPEQSDARLYELYENYVPSFAASMTDNDCSFMLTSTVDGVGSSETYSFTSLSTQFVTVLAVPTASLDVFAVSLSDGSGNVMSTSNATTFINWVQVAVPASTPMSVTITLQSSLQFLSHTYSLFVTGGTQWLYAANITGPQVLSC